MRWIAVSVRGRRHWDSSFSRAVGLSEGAVGLRASEHELRRQADFCTITIGRRGGPEYAVPKVTQTLVNIYEPGPFHGPFEQWPVLAVAGGLEVRLAETEGEIEAAQRLRYRIFYQEMSAVPSPSMREVERDFDQFDAFCDHVLVVDRSALDEEGQPSVVGTYRLMRGADARRAGGFYTAGEYDLSSLLSLCGEDQRLLSSAAPACSRPIAASLPRCSSCGAA